ncbi:MAG: sel1 repeat family protein [Proteobacteria bacterium]|nr:sel1 repeat family protein [Pseudomonadota bacterium]
MRAFAAIVGVVLLLLSGSAAAATFEEGLAALNKGSERKAVEIWTKLGREGDVQSQFALGFLYFHGTAVSEHQAKAAYWFEQAAKQGHPGAQYHLGLMYERGIGTRRDFFRAAEWYQLAVEWGDHREAKYALGLMYLRGRGLPRNESKAVELIRAAADQNHHLAQFIMGDLYENGWGVEKDFIEAFKWYQLAHRGGAVLNDGKSDYKVNERVAKLAEQMTPFELAQSERRINSWLSSHPESKEDEPKKAKKG